jgi:osmotically-inducible protein OsmY
MKSKLFALLIAGFLLASPVIAKDPPPTDATINDAVMLKLSADQVVKGGGLKVDVQNGVVTLSGPVDEPKAKERAVKLTKKVKGVKQVIDKLTIRQ